MASMALVMYTVYTNLRENYEDEDDEPVDPDPQGGSSKGKSSLAYTAADVLKVLIIHIQQQKQAVDALGECAIVVDEPPSSVSDDQQQPFDTPVGADTTVGGYIDTATPQTCQSPTPRPSASGTTADGVMAGNTNMPLLTNAAAAQDIQPSAHSSSAGPVCESVEVVVAIPAGEALDETAATAAAEQQQQSQQATLPLASMEATAPTASAPLDSERCFSARSSMRAESRRVTPSSLRLHPSQPPAGHRLLTASDSGALAASSLTRIGTTTGSAGGASEESQALKPPAAGQQALATQQSAARGLTLITEYGSSEQPSQRVHDSAASRLRQAMTRARSSVSGAVHRLRGSEVVRALNRMDETLKLREQLGIVVIIAVFILYPGWANAVLSIFTCYAIDDGSGPYPQYQLAAWSRGYWIRDMNQQCYSGQHLALYVPVGIVAFLVLCLAPPLVSFGLLWPRRKSLDEWHVRRRFSFLCSRYKPRFWWWESVLMLQALSLVAVEVSHQLMVMLAAFIVLTVINMACRPVKSRVITLLEFTSLAVLSMTLTLSLYFVADTAAYVDVVSADAVGYVIIAINVGMVAAILGLIVRKHWKKIKTQAVAPLRRLRFRISQTGKLARRRSKSTIHPGQWDPVDDAALDTASVGVIVDSVSTSADGGGSRTSRAASIQPGMLMREDDNDQPPPQRPPLLPGLIARRSSQPSVYMIRPESPVADDVRLGEHDGGDAGGDQGVRKME
ncbi:hypothetical protein HXX76_011981 [Chlamydomonas incerta]|uniref:TRP C-terminal domain-containing protein n=1 Tax=Chlamydomonas incerta TaxID=51695 RepID=A0A835SWB1_CHLIN|nr:hypothetical protein HXX76_011981 [Chlamydomonas incerta]|eukprot:KAG2427995.1 hypothetical protein HXX76_011981 [Chlamydomonas incerta]